MGCCHGRSKGGNRKTKNVKLKKEHLPSEVRPGKRKDRRKAGVR